MGGSLLTSRLDRRSILKTGLALGATQVANPFIIHARGEEPIKIGMIDPLTGAYAALAQSEVEGAKLAIARVNANGGILGRMAELLVEDSTNDVGIGVQKARKLIDRDQVNCVLGDVNSGIALAIAGVTSEKKVLHIVPGGHADSITGATCHWNVFRVCNTTTMGVNAIADTLMEKFGKRWYFLTPDYSYGHSVQAAFVKKLSAAGGEYAGDLAPIGTPDYSAYLIKAQAYAPKVLINIMGGGDQVNSLKQFVGFGLEKQMAVGGTLFELESLMAVPAEARLGWWTMEWWWDQPDNSHVKAFVDDVRKATGKTPSARHWFGYVAIHSFALTANQEKTIDALKLAQALGSLKLPPEVALQPGEPGYRAGDHQLISAVFAGNAHVAEGSPDNLFTVRSLLPGEKAAPPVSETGCKMAWPS